MKTLLSALDNRSTNYVFRLSLIIAILLSSVSYLFNTQFPHEIFYIFPVLITSWYGSKRSGVLISSFAVSVLFVIKVWHQTFYPSMILSYLLPYLLSFVALAILVTNFRNAHRLESIAADTDTLTGINNPRGFYADLAAELLRSSRYNHIFSLAFLDIDDFKKVNDLRGHAEGDRLLKEVADCLKNTLRTTDVVGRLGGDEFACVFPETDKNKAREAVDKVREQLQLRMAANNWMVGFSFGLVTFERLPENIKEALKAADDLMYTVKNKGKDGVAHMVWREDYGNA